MVYMTSVKHKTGKVVLTNSAFQCTACGKWKPGEEFGLRKMKDGIIRNQAQCKKCRSKYSKKG